MERVYERQTDKIFADAFAGNSKFCVLFLESIGIFHKIKVVKAVRQVRHHGEDNNGTIDIEVHLSDGSMVLVENKIDAAFSVTKAGDGQPERYRSSATALKRAGRAAFSVLVAPRVYLNAAQNAKGFDSYLSYETLRQAFDGRTRAVIEKAIDQASEPYVPVPDSGGSAFHRDIKAFVEENFSDLAVKRNPNAGGVRPRGSQTIYFDVPRTLRAVPHLPRPRMSLQCRDTAAPSASVKIMLGGVAEKLTCVTVPRRLTNIGGYLRAAGGSLGIAIDTPQLDTQLTLAEQTSQVRDALMSAQRLASWWNEDARNFHI